MVLKNTKTKLMHYHCKKFFEMIFFLLFERENENIWGEP